MNRFLPIFAVFLTGCGDAMPSRAILPDVPAELRRPVLVVCQPGDTVRALGQCAMALRAGLTEANSKIETIDTILSNAEGTK